MRGRANRHASRAVPSIPRDSSEGSAVRQMLRGRRGKLVSLALVSLIAGITEALFLATITRVDFALASEQSSVSLNLRILGNYRTDIPGLLTLAVVLVLCRVTLSVILALLNASLVTSVVSDERNRLAAAFLDAPWSIQSKERAGSLQELLTTSTGRLS